MKQILIVLAYFVGVCIACVMAIVVFAIVYEHSLEREPKKVVSPLIIGNDTVRINQHFQVVK